jgi:lycopene beta-cyclase
MLANGMSRDPFFAQKKILLIDQDKKLANDRTWCFWEDSSNEGKCDKILFHSWNQILVKDNFKTMPCDIAPLKYKMIRSKDFYTAMWADIRQATNIDIVFEKIVSTDQKSGYATVNCIDKTYKANHVFNSIFNPENLVPNHGFPYLKQHFIGWFIKTDHDVFDTDTATFMDFSVEQKGNTRFMYVLPWSKNEALIEYTLFSENLLSDNEYTDAIKSYISDLGIKDYTITETERGIIPMTTYPFEAHNTANITYIGTAGGWAKACTGYTFYNTTKYTEKLLNAIKKGIYSLHLKNKHRWFDHVMLSVLKNNNHIGKALFTTMFARNDVRIILRFLDGESTIFEEIPILLKTKPLLLFTFEAIRTLPHFLFKKIKP